MSEGLTNVMGGRFEVGTSHHPPKRKTKNSFTFMRHPVEWYRSFYAAQVQNYKSNHDSFKDFLSSAYGGMEMLDRNWTTLSDYARPFHTRCGFVGRCENLTEDLKTALDLFGEKYNYEELMLRPPVNQSIVDIYPDEEDIAMILDKERELVELFYNED